MSGTEGRVARVEIAGPAGSGKSTLTAALASRYRVRFGVRPCDPACLPLAVSRLHLLPWHRLLADALRGRLTREPLKSVVYLESWLRDVLRERNGPDAIVVYDHGPFYRLATLEALASPFSPRFCRWWDSMRRVWSTTLTTVVWLDAPNAVLLERIRGRRNGHPCEAMSAAEAGVWLDRYRLYFESALAVVRRDRPGSECRFDTSATSPDQMVSVLADRLG